MKLGAGNHWPARVAVVGLHVAVFALLWQHRPPALRGDGERRIVTLRLLPLPDRRPPPDDTREPARPVLRAPLPLTAPPTLPELPDTPATESAPPPPPTVIAPAPAEPPRTTLRLTLPPGYAASSAQARNPALSDPRSNTPRPTLEDRIADATGGGGAWVEEQTSENRAQSVGALGDRRTVLRRGDTCVEVHRSRIADMDQFNGNVAPRAINMVGKPYKCK